MTARAFQRRRPAASAALLLALAAALPSAGFAAVFHTRDEIPRLAFPNAESVTSQRFFLRPEQRERAEKLARAPFDSDLITVYRGLREGATVGYAVVDFHIVRTLPEALLIVLSPAGEVQTTYVLAFYEPSEYLPAEGWFGQFVGLDRGAALRIGRDVAGVTGSTLSSRAVAAALRRALAIHQVLLSGDAGDPGDR